MELGVEAQALWLLIVAAAVAICMVLALSLPIDLPLRHLLITMIFAVGIFTLLVQVLSLRILLKKLGFVRATSLEAYEQRKGEI